MSVDQGTVETDSNQIAAAARLYAPLRRSASLAKFSGSCLLLFGIPTLLLSLLGFDVVGLLLGGALCACGVLELTSVKRVRAGDSEVFARLGWNQWAVFGVISIYGSLQVIGFDAQELRALLADQGLAGSQLREIDELIPTLVNVIYGTVILVTFVVQGLMARMYFRRRKLAERYAAEVPEQIRRMVQSLPR
jgi:hypothetical protein